METESYCYRSIAPVFEWDDRGNLIRVAAKPLGLGFDGPAEYKGLPRFANEAETALLLEAIRRLSKPYGTEVAMGEDGMLLFLEKSAKKT